MSFRFNWPQFDERFIDKAVHELTVALNSNNNNNSMKSSTADQQSSRRNIADRIEVHQLHMGTQPPELTLLEIGELSRDRFRGIFRLSYAGDAFVVLQTRVQVNPVTLPDMLKSTGHQLYARNRYRISGYQQHYHQHHHDAHKPLIVPMQLRISHLRLRGIMVLVVDRCKGITLCFKDDPLQSVQVNSTFDDMSSVKSTLQSEIENHFRDLFTEKLPSLIHTLSLEKMGLQETRWEEILTGGSMTALDNPLAEISASPLLTTAGNAQSLDSGLGASNDSLDASGKDFISTKPPLGCLSIPSLIRTSAPPSPLKLSRRYLAANNWETRSLHFDFGRCNPPANTRSPLSPQQPQKSETLHIADRRAARSKSLSQVSPPGYFVSNQSEM